MKGDISLPPAVQTMTPTEAGICQSIADTQGFELYRHYTETQAAEFIGVHPATLKKLRLKGGVSFLRLGQRRVAYFGVL